MQIQPRKPALDRADYPAPTCQHELQYEYRPYKIGNRSVLKGLDHEVGIGDLPRCVELRGTCGPISF